MRECSYGNAYDQLKKLQCGGWGEKQKSIVLATIEIFLQQESSVGVYWYSLTIPYAANKVQGNKKACLGRSQSALFF